ncbi:MAG: hypothetical protein AMJ54_11970 [Deltaproteobacteria bacterium SG8_13]|nr:MAG: hypothetical protein AMJ54_11970 [Deltaproteobacteria bacterium SG8_13]
MRTEQPSITAENNAAVRAFESLRPAGQRIFHDPYARCFLPDEFTRTGDTAFLLEERISRWNRLVPGVCDAILARGRFIDDRLLRSIDEGLQQLVILGAGYDTRAFRFTQLNEGVPIYELDDPATQQMKLQRLKKYRLPVPDRLTFIPCRFDCEDFIARLLESGYDPGRITFFIWEGVSYYLSPADVDRIMAFISNHSPAGSAVVFDYFPPSVFDGTSRLDEAVVLRQALKQMGEEITFGIDPDTIEDFLSARGLGLRKHLSSEDLHHMYLKRVNRETTVSKMFYFAQASVSPVKKKTG